MFGTEPAPPSTATWLTIITVVFEDVPGLRRTVESVDRTVWPFPVQHVVVDGSRDAAAAEYSRSLSVGSRLSVVEPDRGIYDAMNKGLAASTGEHVLFLNAGDVISPELRPELLLEAAALAPDAVLMGYCVEVYGHDRYLNPGRGREQRVVHSPHHQSTLYPRAYTTTQRYRLDQPVTADGRFTRWAFHLHGVTFVPTIVSEFMLGGVSSDYGSAKRTWARMRETDGISRLRVMVKFVAWRVVPRRLFYRALASYKYTTLRSRPLRLPTTPWILRTGRPAQH